MLLPKHREPEQSQRECDNAKERSFASVESWNKNSEQVDGVQREFLLYLVRNDILPSRRLRSAHPAQCPASVFLGRNNLQCSYDGRDGHRDRGQSCNSPTRGARTRACRVETK